MGDLEWIAYFQRMRQGLSFGNIEALFIELESISCAVV